MLKQNVSSKLIYTDDSFSRLDESDDSIFYEQDRFVDHLDRNALATVKRVIETLITEQNPVILDLMAGWDSHIPDTIKSNRIVGLGLNRHELEENPALTEYVLHDLNNSPQLPFEDNTFDIIINTVSVDYMVHPFEVFREAGRILKPGGLFTVIFSHRLFPQKAVKIWREANDQERMLMVTDFFNETDAFDTPESFVWRGMPRPEDDKYAHLSTESDPIYVVYSKKKGGQTSRKSRPGLRTENIAMPSQQEIKLRKKQVKKTHLC
ncbi:class I SAM-dependent methyltransferase, partial [candidate division CSSED10-310 bacterium]